MGGFSVFLLIVGFIIFKSAVHILKEYERGVVFRLGRISRTRGPGLRFVIQSLIN